MYLAPTSQGIAVFFSECTEPTQQQEVLGQSEQRYQELLESLSDRIVILTPEELILKINQRFLAEARVRLEEVVGKPFSQCPVWSSSPVA